MRYTEALEEYLLEDDDGKHRLVFAHFGLAIYLGQCLEETFSLMLWTNKIFEKKIKTNKEVNEIIDAIENSKKTMGNFITEVKQSYSLNDSIVKQLTNILNKRNYLAHKYFKVHIEKSYSDVGRLEMIKYFCDFIDESEMLDKQLHVYYKGYTDMLGLTEEKILELANQMKAKEMNREI